MKTTIIKTALTIIILVIFNGISKAQLSIEGGFSFLKFYKQTSIKVDGYGCKTEFGINNKTAVIIGANQYVFADQSYNIVRKKVSKSFAPEYIDVTVTDKLKVFNMYIGAKRYMLGSNSQSTLGFYGFGDLGFMVENLYSTF